jgi:amino acid adenylation domain-containing protein/non-ribosomal peptide synthase protein (TIGR01720 family)
VSRVYDAFGVDVPLRSFFEAPTVATLSARVERLRREAEGLSAPPIEPVPRDGDLPLSFAQQRLWFLDHLEPDSAVYNVPDAVRIRGVLDVDALERSLKELVQRHEVLRTTFPTRRDGKPALAIASESSVSLPIVDLMALSEAEQEAEAERLARAEARRPFNLERGPLLRTCLLRLSEEDHVALLTMHHIVSDGWSTTILVREIAFLYDAFSSGRPSPLPSLPMQYVDFAHWQREWLQGDVLERQLGYWEDQLAGLPPRLDLPTDHPRPSLQSSRGSYQAFALPKELSNRVQALSRQEGATVFMTLLATFQVLLSRYTGQVDICVGTPIANRNRSEVEDLIGFFVNTLVMRCDLSGSPSFRDLLRHVKDVALDAYAHQDVPFEMLVEALQPERDTSHTPLFQVMLMLQNAPMKAMELSGITLSSMEVETGTAMFDLTLAMEESRDGLRGAIEYNADLFDAATIRRMKIHFRTLLERVVADPDQPISAVSLLTAAEQRQILIEWNDSEIPYVPDVCLHQVFQTQAKRTPHATAVALPAQHWVGSKERGLTYAQLNERANRLAHRLQKLGVGPETLVGLCADRSLDMFVGLLGILKAGGAYLPLDPTYPDERLSFMMQDAQISALLTQERLLERLSTLPDADSLVCLDSDWPSIAGEPDDNPESDVTSGNAAYVIYTSGSTGRPKGVLVSHRSVVNHNVAVAQQFQLRPDDRVLQFATINFDAAVEEIFPTWLRGATLILRADDVLTTGEDLLRLVDEERLTVLDLPTAYWHEWVYELALLKEPLPESLRLVIVGGEKASAERFVAWQRIAGDNVSWLNTYGPTEGTIVATAYEPPADTVWDVNTEIPIGRPIANAQIRLLDRNLQPVPVGVPGELFIGGDAVARGYLNRPTLTAESFIPDPFSREPGRRLYGTGDLARYLPEGTVEFLGRVDHQVKVRGFRVEPGEIETMLVQHPYLRDAIVVAQEGDAGDTRLVAYVVAVQDPAPTVDVLRDVLKQKLPDYMVPSTFVAMASLPLTASGKVDRRALPTPEQERPALASAYIAPRTEDEGILASIWAEVLGVESIGVHDNFFELGGDSILTIQVVARAKQAGVHVSPRQLFESPTVAGLAMAAGTGPVIQAEQGIVEGPVPLTPIQRWFFDQQLPEYHHWNQSMMVEVEHDLEPPLIEETVEHLLVHHDALRLRFERGEQSWQQVNAGLDGAVPFVCVDLSGLPAAEQGPAIEARAAALQASLDLTEGPLMRVAYFDRGSEHRGHLLLIVHHLVMDGVSWRILLEDFQAVYGQLQRGEAVQLPPKTTSFRRWARRLEAYAQSDEVREQLPYWLSLGQASISSLPVDFHDGDNTEASVQNVVVSLSEEETQALLKEVPAAYRTEINDVLLTALALAITRWVGSRSLLVELEGHGREDIWDDVDISRTLGWFTATYPLTLTLERGQGLGEALMAVKKQLRRVANRGIGYGLLRYLCEDVGEQLRGLPRPDIAFNYLGQFDQPGAEGSSLAVVPESRGPDRSPKGHRAHLLEVDGGIAGGRLRLEWTYSENLYRRTTIERVAQSFKQALGDLIVHCRTPEAGGVTPSDFGLADLSDRKLDKVLKKIGQGRGTSRR